MHRPSLLLGLLLVAPRAFAQAPPSDSQTLQALLVEVRQLRQDLQTHSADAYRMQILFFRIQTQQSVVARVAQRADDARAELAETQAARKKAEGNANDIKDQLEHTDNPAQQKDLEGMGRYYKQRLQELNEEEEQRQSKQIEAEEQLRIEQAKLDDFQSRLDEIDKVLQKSAGGPANNPR